MDMQHITTNLAGKIRYDEMEGRKYLVAPMVMMAEGVLNGSGGPLYYPKEELAKTPAVWNYKPVVVYHPMANGQSVSACDPDILTTQKVGVIMNTRFTDEGKLKAEAWLETDRVKAVDDRILDSIENNKVMELSTGLFTDNEAEEGEYKGIPYEAIARNYRPDHLALLPDKKGAYSVEDGAGLLRNELSFDNIRSKLQTLAREKYPGSKDGLIDVWVADVYKDFFILEKGSDLLKMPYTSTKDEVSLGTGSEKVKRKTEYVTMDGSFVGNANVHYVSNAKGFDMSKEKLVGELIANEQSQWTDEDKDFLMGLEEDKLEKLAPIVNEVEVEKIVEKVVEKPAVPVENEDETPPTAEEYIANAPEGIRDMLNVGLRTHEAQRQELIANVKANKKNVFTDEQLGVKSLGELQCLAALCVPEKPAKPVPLYYGASTPAPAPVENEVTEVPLSAPVMSWD